MLWTGSSTILALEFFKGGFNLKGAAIDAKAKAAMAEKERGAVA